jgi:response regulator RpfG family c-di-GMP phosphodiesterase
MALGDAVALILDGRGSWFDPRVIDVLLRNVEEILGFRD